MSLALLRKKSLLVFFAKLDLELADALLAERCPHCGASLHRASWIRKPRGADDIPDQCLTRHGLCCGHCRRRQLPASCLFDGRRIYLRPVLLLVVALRQARPESITIARVCKMLGVARHTVRRWCRYFADVFPSSGTWLRLRGKVGAQVSDDRLPADVMDWLSRGRLTARTLARVTVFLARGTVPDVSEVAEG